MSDSHTKALYAFSADPITNGHVNIVERISETFHSVIVAIGKNPNKSYTFTENERLALAKQSLGHLPNVEVVSINCMLVDFARSQGAKVIVKGVRNAADFNYEQTLHQVGESQKLNVDTHLLFADPKLAHVSSSIVKGIQQEHGDIRSYVPLPVKNALEVRISKQWVVGITGSPACGKSTVCEEMVKLGAKKGLDIHNIELDYIGHKVFEDLTIPLHREVRDELKHQYGSEILDSNGKVNRKRLAHYVFNDYDSRIYLNKLMATPINILLRQEMKGKEGIILLNGALLYEGDYLEYCNNRVFVIDADKQDQEDRMKLRGLTEQQINLRLTSQKTGQQKVNGVKYSIKRHNFGHVMKVNTSKLSAADAAETIIEAIGEQKSIFLTM